MTDLVKDNILRHDKEISSLNERMNSSERMQDKLSMSIDNLCENVNDLAKSVSNLSVEIKDANEKITNLKLAIEKRINFTKFLAENWFRFPQMIIIAGGILYAANYLYDLPPPTQIEKIKKLEEIANKNDIRVAKQIL